MAINRHPLNNQPMVKIISDELTLKQLAPTDAAAIFSTIDSQRAYLGQWLPFVAYTQSVADTESFVQAIVNAPEADFEYVFTIRKHDEFVGLIGFKDTDRLNHKTEIGYWLSEPYQKQGIVTKSVQKLIEFAFEELAIHRIQIKCATGNLPSKNIPRKLGFVLEGVERQGECVGPGSYRDLEIYSLLRSDI